MTPSIEALTAKRHRQRQSLRSPHASRARVLTRANHDGVVRGGWAVSAQYVKDLITWLLLAPIAYQFEGA
jgi:hypothetical protein